MTPVVIGAASTRFGRFPDRTVRSLAQEAAAAALADAGLAAGGIDLVVFANAAQGLTSGQEMIRGQAALRHSGLAGLPMVNVENACASSGSAFAVACWAIGSESARTALVVGAEKLTHPDRERTRLAAS